MKHLYGSKEKDRKNKSQIHYFQNFTDVVPTAIVLSWNCTHTSILREYSRIGKSEYVMRSIKRDYKSANVNFEIVEYVVDDCLTNIKKKRVDQKVQKWLS